MWIASYPLVICYIAIEHGTVEIVSFPIQKGDFPWLSIVFCTFTRGSWSLSLQHLRASTFFRYSKAMRSWWPSMVPLLRTYDIWQYLWKVCNCSKLCYIGMGQKNSKSNIIYININNIYHILEWMDVYLPAIWLWPTATFLLLWEVHATFMNCEWYNTTVIRYAHTQTHDEPQDIM